MQLVDWLCGTELVLVVIIPVGGGGGGSVCRGISWKWRGFHWLLSGTELWMRWLWGTASGRAVGGNSHLRSGRRGLAVWGQLYGHWLYLMTVQVNGAG